MNCPHCGAPIDEKTIESTNTFKPISMWGYFGYEILFSIPIVGFILLIVFSAGGTQNANLKNFARSYFCYYIIIAVIAAIVLGILAASGACVALSSGMSGNY